MTTFVVRIFMHLTDLLCIVGSLPVKVGILGKNLCRKFQRPLTHAREHTVNCQSLHMNCELLCIRTMSLSASTLTLLTMSMRKIIGRILLGHYYQ